MISLLRDLNFAAIAKHLELNIHRYSLPTTSECPLCKVGKARFMQDMLTGGVVFACNRCKERGDLIYLLSRLWRVDELGVCYKMKQLGLSWFGDFDAVELIQAREKHRKSTTKSDRVKQAILNPGLRDGARAQVASERLGLRLPVSYAEAKDFCPNIFGCASLLDIKAAEDKVSRKRTSDRSVRDASRPVIVVPFYDLPGRVVSYSLIDREEPTSRPREVRHLLKYGQYREEGFACHPDLIFASRGSVLITPSTYVAIKLWAKASLQSYFKFPLAVAKEGSNCWQLFGDKHRIVVAMGKNDFEAVRLAVRIDAMLYFVPAKGEFDKWVNTVRTSNLHRDAVASKQHWSVAINKAASKMNADDAFNYIGKLQLQADEMVRLKEAASSSLKRVLAHYNSDSRCYRSVNFRSGVVEQKLSDWIFRSRGRVETICNAAVTIKELVRYCGKTIASVEVVQDERVVTFQTDYQQLFDHFYKTVHDECIRAGIAFISPRHWHGHLHTIAMRFFSPEMRDGHAFVGYDPTVKGWMTPSHTVKRGRIIEKPRLPDWVSLPGMLRTKNKGCLKYFRSVSLVTIGALIAAVHQATASALRQPKPPVLFSGHASLMHVQETMAALGAVENNKEIHDWFLVKTKINQSSRMPTSKQVDSAFVDSGWLLTTDAQRCYGAFNGAISLCDGGNELDTPGPDHRQYVASMFLYLLKNWKGETNTVEYCLEKLDDRGIDVDKSAIDACLQIDVDPMVALVALLKEIQSRGTLVYGEQAEATKRVNVVRAYKDKQSVIIPSGVIERAVNTMALGAYDSVKIMHRLSKSPSYRNFTHYNGTQGWLIQKSFFDKAIRDKRLNVETFDLRIVG